MKLPRYPLKAGSRLHVFEFVSEGVNGRIPKLVEFTETNQEDLFNLAFGDEDPVTGRINDTIISNNGDMNKVLATVVSAVFAFTDRFPDAWVYATGSTKSRTRLYRMGLSKYYDVIQETFHLFGELGDNWVPFEKNAEYEGFLVRRKIS